MAAHYAKILDEFTFGLFVIGAAQAILFLWQLNLIRQSLVDTKEAAEAAKDTAKATGDQVIISRSAMIASLRAYVFPTGVNGYWKTDKQGAFHWRFRTVWTNSGDSPTKNMTFCTYCEVRDKVAVKGDIFTELWGGWNCFHRPKSYHSRWSGPDAG